MTDSQALVPVAQREVTFYDDTIVAVRLASGDVFVPVRPICDRLGVAWSAQRLRINRDPVLASEMRSVIVTITDLEAGSSRPQTSEMLCLPLDYISGFLFGINATRVKDDIRERLIRYQRECYRALADAFQEGRLTAEPSFDELLAADSPAAQAYKMAVAIMQMARQQILLESQVSAHATRLDQYGERLEAIEGQLGDPGRHVTPDQASQISQAVKAVAMALSKASGTNQYGSVYGELYRRFGITSYKLLPAARFEEAMAWLTEWHASLTGREPF